MIYYHRHTVVQTPGPVHSHAQSDAKTREKALVYAMSDILYQRFAAIPTSMLIVDCSNVVDTRRVVHLFWHLDPFAMRGHLPPCTQCARRCRCPTGLHRSLSAGQPALLAYYRGKIIFATGERRFAWNI